MTLKTIATISTFATLALALPLTVTATTAWDDWVSEENGSPWSMCGPINQAVAGFDCSGGYCDDVRVRCQTMPNGITVSGYNFSDWFSEENTGIGTWTSAGWYRYDDSYSHVCNYSGESGIMTAVHCKGSNCDDIQLECATPRRVVNGAWQAVPMVDCGWTGWYSEEQPPLTYAVGANRFVTGVRCRGSYCDDKQFYVCSLDIPGDSCGGQCNSSAPAGCWCDGACQNYGDCCDDYVDVCIP
ncbi:MAG: hypothetical protein AAGF11_15265 [Myxococcota bacterium]